MKAQATKKCIPFPSPSYAVSRHEIVEDEPSISYGFCEWIAGFSVSQTALADHSKVIALQAERIFVEVIEKALIIG